jgi:pyruvate/2-oxoglutarate dehydrogenase complex dihydrolipoamide dehydrogenase (E3) component
MGNNVVETVDLLVVGSARTLVAARDAGVMGVGVDGEPTVSAETLRRHKESVVGGMVAAHEKMVASSRMDFILGSARFVGERTVEISMSDGRTGSSRAETS